MTHRYGLLCTLAVLGAGCASSSLGVAGEAVPVTLDRVVWSEHSEAGQYHGVLTLVEDDAWVDTWRLHLDVPGRLFEERGPVEIAQLPLGSRVFLMDPEEVEYRGRGGSLILSRRGGGALSGGFGRAGEMTDVILELSWTSWHVSDRRRLGGATDPDLDPSLTR